MDGDGLLDSVSPAVLAPGTSRHHRRGSRLFEAGDASGLALFVRTGIAKVSAPRLDGAEVVLALRGPGTWLDAQSVLAGAPHLAGAVALTDIAVVEVDRDRLLDEVRAHPELSHELVQHLGGALRSALGDLRARAEGDPTALLARRLVQLAVEPAFTPWRSTSSDGAITVGVPITQTELGSWAGISSRAATAALRRLHDDGIISTSRMRFDVSDLGALRARAAADG